jgi:hypothetical protein
VNPRSRAGRRTDSAVERRGDPDGRRHPRRQGRRLPPSHPSGQTNNRPPGPLALITRPGIACENRLMALKVRVAGREDDDHIPVPDGTTPRDELTRFLNRQGPYAQLWIKLSSGEYVRYEHIVSISVADESALT